MCPCQSIFNCFESKKLPDDFKSNQQEDDEDSEAEKLLDELEEARLFAVNHVDLYNNEGLEHYLGHFDPEALAEMLAQAA